VTVNAGHSGLGQLSDSGSRTGAAGLGQAASDAASVTVHRLLTCADAVTWPVWLLEYRIRIEGVRGSNPFSSTEFLQVKGRFRSWDRPFCYQYVQQRLAVELLPRCFPGLSASRMDIISYLGP